MGQDYGLLTIMFVAASATFVLYFLWSQLGKRTGNERRRDPFAARERATSPRTAKGREGERGSDRTATGEAVAPGAIGAGVGGTSLEQVLTEIQLADRNFDVGQFLGGSKAAYGIIVKAFAAGDRGTLQPLVSKDVYESFVSVIEGREKRGEKVEFDLIAIKDAKITDASLEGRTAQISVTFEAELSTVTKNADGAVVAGDPGHSAHVIDIWTFARDVKSKSPEWTLVATDTAV